jgi:nascent polypeptide-associated complex subunit beta
VGIGGKGTARGNKKVVHRTATANNKRLQLSLEKLGVNNISGIEEVTMFTTKEQGSILTTLKFRHPWQQTPSPLQATLRRSS